VPDTPVSLHELSASQAAALVRERKVSPVELVDALLARAEAVDGRVAAWELLDPDGARRAAREAEVALSAGAELGLLHGVPFGVKDIFDTAGIRTAAGFPPYDRRTPRADAESVARLKRAGGIVLGKTVTTQFAQADPSKTRNPWSIDATPGGSSSGSAAGVAAREMPMALGSQTAGSVLRPAAYNGVVGFKPTFMRVSRQGVLPLAWSLDTVGVLTRSVADCALWLDAELDAPESPAVLEGAPRLGLVEPALDRAAARVADHVREVARRFAGEGADVRPVRFDHELELVLAVHHTIMQTEAAANHWQLVEQHPGAFRPRLRAYVEVGRLLPGASYVHAQRLRQRIRADLLQRLRGFDALLLPTASDVAPLPDTTGDPSLQAPFTLVGFPSISLPSGVLADGNLPFAIQLVGAPEQDARLLALAAWCERTLPPMPAPPL
jgi:aspartyl-tRNA(Asn)/glutamyl-tRNA(Gln) amidotransferase subunit A